MVVAPLGAFLAAAATAAVAFSPTNLSFVLPHAESAPLAILFSLAFLVALGRYIGGGGTRWLVASGVCAGLVGLTRPEFAAAVLFAAVVWSLLRIRARLSTRREILAFLACAVAIPAATYGAFLTAISPQTLLFENLVPLDVLSGGANEILRLHAPLTPSSILEVAGYLALYVAGVAVLLLLARLLARSTRAPRLTLLVCAVLATAFVAMLALRPETVRYGLKFAYGWIPAGVAVALAVALWYARRRGARWEPKEQIELVTAALLAVLAAKTYAVFFIHSSEPQYAVYALPFAAVLLARLHLGRLGRRRPAYWLGALWMVALVTSGVALTIRDARVESAEVRGPGGVVRDRPAEAQAYQDALAWIAKETRPGEPILLAPQLTTLYTLSERESPLPELALQPGALPTVEDERAAITRLEEAGVRLVVVDRRSFQEFGHTTFGDSFDRVLAGWIRSRFAVAATVGTNLPAARALEIWTRRHS